jgi:DNA-binding beta-propeller fold protein YncE
MFKTCVVAALVALAQAPLAGAGTWTVVASFQGFNAYNGYGIEADGTYLYTLDPDAAARIIVSTTTGSWVRTVPLPSSALDLDFDGTFFWVGHGDRYCRRYTSTGSLLNSFLPGSLSPRGIVWDGTYIWVSASEGSSYNIYRMNTTGSIYSSFRAPGGGTGGLDRDGAYLWAAQSFFSRNVYKITTTGSIVDSFTIVPPTTYPYGVAWDGNYLWTTNFNNRWIYKWRDVTGVTPASLGRVKALYR